MNFRLLIFLVLSITTRISIAQEAKVNWLSFEELATQFKEEQKPVLIFIYTDWCKYCKMQKNTTFKDTFVVTTLNEKYYVLKLNAEREETVSFFGREYTFNQQDGFHGLATYLGKTDNKLEFPTTLILNKQLEVVFRESSLVNRKEIKSKL